MTTPHQYHQPNAPDEDSDLELDLEELDPLAAHARSTASPPRRQSKEQKRPYHELGARIPLRNLRVGRLRANRRKEEPEEEDLRGLLDDDEARNRNSAGSSGMSGDDDAPLLSSNTKRSRHERKPSALSRIGSNIRLPSFLTPRADNGGIQLGDDAGGSDADEEHDPTTQRTISVGQLQASRFPANAVSNAKYTPWSFLPRTLYNEFSFFINMYFLLVAMSQLIPALRLGYLSTYVVPLGFVITITLGKEALDDIARRRRDAEANSEAYTVLKFEENSPGNGVAPGKTSQRKKKLRKQKAGNGRLTDIEDEEQRIPTKGLATCSYHEVMKPSRALKVGDVVKLGKDQRVPADMVLLKSYSTDASASASDQDDAHSSPTLIGDDVEATAKVDSATATGPSGEAFIRTDQLDGETDWKLRLTSPLTQNLPVGEFTRLRVVAGKPDRKVNEFYGTVELEPKRQRHYDAPDEDTEPSAQKKPSAPLNIDNTIWANTVVASTCSLLAVVVYTGPQTRQALSTSPSRSKTGLLELEINSLTKWLCIFTLTLSFVLVALARFQVIDGRQWYVSMMRFLILFSTIVPVGLRVNLDMGKSVYAWFIEHDQSIKGTVVRTSTIPEDLGRIEYLLSDKTGTLTQNEMVMKKIHVGTVSYANEAMDEVSSYVRQCFTPAAGDTPVLVTPSSAYTAPLTSATRTRREIGSRVRDVVLALALCHNVTPTTEEENGEIVTTYQASSPDEVAIVRWTEAVGLKLLSRDRESMTLQSCDSGDTIVKVRILNVFPFTSEGKRMGIVVKFYQGSPDSPSDEDGEVWFYQKGADTVMTSIVAANDWLDEETANMAREGLRTLVVGRKKLSAQIYQDFSNKYAQASLALNNRDAVVTNVIKEYLESDLELLGVTGVEDKLQKDVKPSLELLRNAGIKIWMLTGDKVETARCVAVSSKLVARGQYVHTIAKMKRRDLAHSSLDFLRGKTDACLLIDGESLALMLNHYRQEFISVAVQLPTVVACRCSPTQKADVARLIREYTKKRVCCIGDGGNDVSMIQAADVGVGIVGKEGRQASLAADFSIEQFCYLTKLLVWHGRNSYKRSAKLSQFVIHRGLIISICQTVYSIASSFEPNALYKDWLLVGYSTIYTMMPVFSLVLDRDVDESVANLYPELYAELKTGRSLSYKSFFIWVAVSIYQGSMIQGLCHILVGVGSSTTEDLTFRKMVSVSFTVLVMNELIMVAMEVTTWHWIMIASIVGTAGIYFGSIPFLERYFDLAYVGSTAFWWRFAVVAAISLVPPYAVKILGRTLKPPSYRKVQGV
ncbi:P-type phospholipid transporter [Parastagonospora nodorum]|nr:P-type phospholipid transporter [Parastagonospora nodorum]KAH3971386.1 P-type phospholipid transporter [Parastagonospora nodorum]KAH3982199.1 P-type phospholipid transporter [Parastagonospora nodorum]KAH4007959.1 P-type phospholipid transporter [Parastagonospora nodorum]KAH4023490.1 P-type phospholipid transporter [Parastagonospora nodorum]